MSDTVSSEVIEALVGKLTTFADTLEPEERAAFDQFFLQAVDDDVAGFTVDPQRQAIDQALLYRFALQRALVGDG